MFFGLNPWQWLLIASVLLWFRNPPMAGVFVVHLLLMQVVKHFGDGRELQLYIFCYAFMGTIAAFYFDKIAGFALLLCCLVYIAAFLFDIPLKTRGITADAIMVLAITLGFIHGPPEGKLVARTGSDRDDIRPLADIPTISATTHRKDKT